MVNPKLIFNKYDYLSSSSKALRNHYKQLVLKLERNNGLKENSTVVDIGYNDGVLLNNYSSNLENIIGIEPSDASKKLKIKR